MGMIRLSGIIMLFMLCFVNRAAEVNFHLDSKDELLRLKKSHVGWTSEWKVAGKGAAMLLAEGNDKAHCNFSIPQDTPEGVLTFWVYDPIFELAKERTWLTFMFSCKMKENGKIKGKNYSFNDFLGKSYGGWMFGSYFLR